MSKLALRPDYENNKVWGLKDSEPSWLGATQVFMGLTTPV